MLHIIFCSFQNDFFTTLNKNYIGKNLIISPISAYQALGLTCNGAVGQTQEQIIKALGENSLAKVNIFNKEIINLISKFSTIEIANAVMSRFTPKQTFLEIAKKYSASSDKLVSLSQVNNWCSVHTHGKIKKILDDLTDDVRMIILNAVYFKGQWNEPFKKSLTTKKSFYNQNEIEKSVYMMKTTKKMNYYEDQQIQIAELLYKEDGMSAVIILPKEKVNINELINDKKLQEILVRSLNSLKKSKVDLELPKFELDFSEKLNNVLKELGMIIPFTGAADFSGLTKDELLYIDSVIQKTYLKVDEEGTEAAAVTAVITKMMSARPMPEIIYEMHVNRPFLFLLKNDQLPAEHNLLFMAKIENL